MSQFLRVLGLVKMKEIPIYNYENSFLQLVLMVLSAINDFIIFNVIFLQTLGRIVVVVTL